MKRVALVQMKTTQDPNDNLKTVQGFVKEAQAQGAEMVCFPEGALTGYLPKEGEPLALKPDDLALKEIQTWACQEQVEVYIGASLLVEDKGYNAYLQIGKDIDWVNKTHLGKREGLIFQAGDQIRCFDSQLGQVGAAICLESHYPGIFTRCRALGALLMILPFASPAVCGPRGKMWRKILPARAYDNGMYVLATNLCGFDGDRQYSGGMMAVDPKGEIIGEYDGDDDHMMMVDLDLDKVEALRRINGKANYFDKRKPDLYR